MPRFAYSQAMRIVLLSTLFLISSAKEAREEKYCDMCELLMDDAKHFFGSNFSQVNDVSLTTTTSSLCGKYFVGFEEVICRILCQVNAADLLKALQDGVPNHTICAKGGVCSDGFRLRR